MKDQAHSSVMTYSECSGEVCHCRVCPHNCRLSRGMSGICRVRQNRGNNKIELISYGLLSSVATDPIEKKPLYHFFPGFRILSLGSFGCNLRCDFCQNYSISSPSEIRDGKRTRPAEIVEYALSLSRNAGIAFTYNEPVVWIEYVYDTAVLAHEAGLKTVMVSNGYINKGPLNDLLSVIDAFNIDLKFFNNGSYRKYSGATLKPVLDTLTAIASSGSHLEITSLIIPGVNDSEEEIAAMASWIADECGKDTPFHLSGYRPAFRRSTPPTSPEALSCLHKTASSILSFVYVGNAPSLRLSDTICPDCHSTVTVRTGYATRHLAITNEGNCGKCGRSIYLPSNLPSSGR